MGSSGALAAPVVAVTELVDPAVALPGVSDDRRSGSTRAVTMGCDDSAGPSVRIAIRQRPRRFGPLMSMANPTSAFLPLARPPDRPGSSADVGLVRLDGPDQPVPLWSHERRPQPVQDRPGGGADLEGALQAERRNAVLRRGEQPAGSEPHRERRPGSVEDRGRRKRFTPGPSICGPVRRPAEVIDERAPITSCSPCWRTPRSKSCWA